MSRCYKSTFLKVPASVGEPPSILKGCDNVDVSAGGLETVPVRPVDMGCGGSGYKAHVLSFTNAPSYAFNRRPKVDGMDLTFRMILLSCYVLSTDYSPDRDFCSISLTRSD